MIKLTVSMEVKMQIKKINNDKLKVILNSHDLDEKNIDIDAFLSNSIESQNLFFEILDLAEEEYDFNIENNKAIVETISLDNNLFVLTITKLKNHSNTYSTSPRIYCFENRDDLFNFYTIHCQELKNAFVYELNEKYYYVFDEITPPLENILCEYASPIRDCHFLEDVLVEYGKKIN